MTSHLAAVPAHDAPPATEPPGADAGGAAAPPTAPTETTAKPRRAPSRHPLPSDRLKFPNQVDTLRGFATASKPGQEVTIKTVKAMMSTPITEGTLALNNNFFVDVGFLQKKGRGSFVAAQEVRDFARQFSFDRAAAGVHLAPLLRKSWAFEVIEDRLSMGEATREQMVNSLAVVADADASFAVQLGSLLDWFELAGIIHMDGNIVSLVNGSDGADGGGGAGPAVGHPPMETERRVEPTTTGAPSTPRADTVVSLSFDLALTAEDLAKLDSEQITALFQGVGTIAAVKSALA